MPRAKLKATEHHTHLCFSEQQQPCVPALFKRICLTNALITIAFLQLPHIRTSEYKFQLKAFPIATSLGFRHSFRKYLAPLCHRIFLTIASFQFYFTDRLIRTIGKKTEKGAGNIKNSAFIFFLRAASSKRCQVLERSQQRKEKSDGQCLQLFFSGKGMSAFQRRELLVKNPANDT